MEKIKLLNRMTSRYIKLYEDLYSHLATYSVPIVNNCGVIESKIEQENIDADLVRMLCTNVLNYNKETARDIWELKELNVLADLVFNALSKNQLPDGIGIEQYLIVLVYHEELGHLKQVEIEFARDKWEWRGDYCSSWLWGFNLDKKGKVCVRAYRHKARTM